MIRPFGERARLVEVTDAAAAQRLDADLRARPPAGMVGTVPGRSSVLVEVEPSVEAAALDGELMARAAALRTELPPGRERTIPVVYGGDHAPDLDAVAEVLDLTASDLVELHSRLELRVLFLGFAPGFPYLGDLPERLQVPRLVTPRTRTPTGSVGIAGAMTGIYPAELPGGWRVIGRTPIGLFDPHRDPPAYLAPGDVVRFEPISAADWDGRSGPPADW